MSPLGPISRTGPCQTKTGSSPTLEVLLDGSPCNAVRVTCVRHLCLRRCCANLRQGRSSDSRIILPGSLPSPSLQVSYLEGLTSGFQPDRPRLQRRARDGLSPSSLSPYRRRYWFVYGSIAGGWGLVNGFLNAMWSAPISNPHPPPRTPPRPPVSKSRPPAQTTRPAAARRSCGTRPECRRRS